MNKNPLQVFYLKGEQERLGAWINGILKEELQTRVISAKNRDVPLKGTLNDFFLALPEAIYITTPQDNQEYIRISPFGREVKEIKELSLSAPLESTQGPVTYIDQNNFKVEKNESPPEIVSIIKPDSWQKHYAAKSGMAQLSDDQGATAWGTLSAPIEALQKLIGFNHDAFVMLTIDSPLTKSTITLFNRSGSDATFKKDNTFNIATGITESGGEGMPAKDYFTIGSSMALIQGVPIMGQRTKRGMTVRLKKENDAGGIHNTFFRSLVYNDNYTPQLTRKNINRLISKDKTSTILLPVGSPTLASYLDYIHDNKLLVLFPITGAPQFRDSSLKNIVHFRGTYADEVHALVDYMVQEGAAKKFAFFYQDDAYGKGPLEAAGKELRKKGITEWVDVPYQRNSVNYKAQAQKIKEAQPDAIGLFSTAEATRELIRQIGIDFLINKQLFGISFLGEESFRRFIKHTGLKVLFGAVVPNPNTSDLEIVKEYRKEMDKNGFPYDIFSLEAYITTSIVLDAIKKISPPITKEKILHQLEQLNGYKFKGLTLTFDPKRRDLAQYVWIETEKNKEWIQRKINKTPLIKKENDARGIDTSRSK